MLTATPEMVPVVTKPVLGWSDHPFFGHSRALTCFLTNLDRPVDNDTSNLLISNHRRFRYIISQIETAGHVFDCYFRELREPAQGLISISTENLKYGDV